jgi:RNA polymerase sigma-70 factor (ECF subfamily)
MLIPRPSSGDESSRAEYVDLLNCSEEQIVREICAGNNDAFAIIFRRYHRLVHVTALRILRDAGEAEDLTQSVFLEIYRKVGQFDPARGTLKVWLLQYAYSRSVSRRNYLQAREVHLEAGAKAGEEVKTLWRTMHAPRQETALLTEQILATLTAPQQETIRMFFFQGLTLKEIAESRQESFSNVRHHYYRGLQRLHTVLAEGIDEKDRKPGLVPFGEVRRAET